VLYEFTVPGPPQITPFLPIEHKFGNGVFDEGQADVGVFDQYFHGVPAGAPVAVHGALPVAPHLLVRFLQSPLAQQVLEKLGAPRVVAFAPFAPIGNKFGQLSAHKVLRDIVLGNVAHQLGIRLPVGGEAVG